MKQHSSHGGPRPGAGRKPGSGNYGEPTVALRVPTSQQDTILSFLKALRQPQQGSLPPANAAILVPDNDAPDSRLPLFGSRIPAGFPSFTDDHIETRLDLNELLVRRKEATFFLRVKGSSMTGAGIFDGDLIVVDRSLEPANNTVVVAVIDGELTVKRLEYHDGRPRLSAENPDFAPTELRDGQELTIWGVVTSVIHTVS